MKVSFLHQDDKWTLLPRWGIQSQRDRMNKPCYLAIDLLPQAQTPLSHLVFRDLLFLCLKGTVTSFEPWIFGVPVHTKLMFSPLLICDISIIIDQPKNLEGTRGEISSPTLRWLIRPLCSYQGVTFAGKINNSTFLEVHLGCFHI